MRVTALPCFLAKISLDITCKSLLTSLNALRVAASAWRTNWYIISEGKMGLVVVTGSVFAVCAAKHSAHHGHAKASTMSVEQGKRGFIRKQRRSCKCWRTTGDVAQLSHVLEAAH